MATTLNTMYPPQVETFMPSFCYNDPAVVWFNISSYNEDMINSIQFIHVSMVDQRTNKNVFAGVGNNTFPQYYPIQFIKDSMYDVTKKMYKLTIPPQVLKTSPYYNVGQYYKVQLRFDLTVDSSDSIHKGPTAFFYWESISDHAADALGLASYTNENEDNFSEWSTGTLLKPILIPELTLQTFGTTRTDINPSTDVPVVGKINFNKINNDNYPWIETEELLWYQIKILNDNKTITYYDSNKIYTNTKNQINYKIDMSALVINTNYQMQIIYQTNHGYIGISDYPIKIIDYDNTTNIECTKIIDENNGKIILNITELTDYQTGYLIVRRASHRSNFTKWDLIAAYDISSQDSLEIIDNTIESMTGYRYQLQYIDDDVIYAPQYIEDEDIIHCDFYGALLSDKHNTLKISFNFELSNRTNAANRTKTDTLGGQYPIFTQNSRLKYHTYSISGRISSEDDGEFFLPKEEVFGNEYYNYRYNINENTDTSAFGGESGSSTLIKKIQPNNDWLYEREYRDTVEEWLNNGKPKLFRSMTEGNMIVMLDGVSMTPDTVLGRRLYDFSATMYEIGNGKDIDFITSFGLFDVIDER